MVVCSAGAVRAQKHSVFTDAGISFSRFKPGVSVTYNYSLAPRFAVGIGAQIYHFHATKTNQDGYIPAVFADLRYLFRQQKKGRFFSFLDLGMNFYSHNDTYWRENNTIYRVQKDNGFYAGLGFGYNWLAKKHPWAPYTSLKFIGNWYKMEGYNLVAKQQSSHLGGGGTLAAAVGIRF
jgi:hypothetical protein